MTDLADARNKIHKLFESLSTGEDAERRVGDLEQLAELKKILDGSEPSQDDNGHKSTADESADENSGQDAHQHHDPSQTNAVDTITAAASQQIMPVSSSRVQRDDRYSLRYRVDSENGTRRLTSKEQVGQNLHETFSALKRSGRPGQTMTMMTYRATGIDTDENGQVDSDIERQRSQAVINRSADRIGQLASMTPIEAARSHVEAGVGFCAPPTPVHEFCEVDADAGILDMATFVMPPAGVRLPSEPDLTPIFENLACLSEADEIAREDPKPCWTIECPEWNDITPCLLPLCIEVGVLTRWAFPELVDKVLAEGLRKYEQFINAANISAIANSDGTIHLDFSNMIRTGAINDLVSAVLMAASQYRTKWRLDPNYPLRLVAPSFVGDVLASDGNRRAKDTEMLGLARAVIETTLAKQSIEVVWVYDWQDAQAQGDPDGWGGSEYVTAWPENADLLLFAPDSWQQYREELVRVQGLRQESTLLRDNRELALFVESAHAVVQRCKETLRLTIPLCPAGTHQIQTWDGETCPI